MTTLCIDTTSEVIQTDRHWSNLSWQNDTNRFNIPESQFTSNSYNNAVMNQLNSHDDSDEEKLFV
jgi:hypothetical protein